MRSRDVVRNTLTLALAHGGNILASYNEVETARKDSLRNRPELVKALAHARRCKATLVIARLDRLARSVLVTSQLMASGVDFIACDNPHANRGNGSGDLNPQRHRRFEPLRA